MKKTILAILAALSVLTINAQAVTVMGARSCGNWVRDRQNEQAWSTLADEAWLVGFLSGNSVSTQKDFLAGVSAEPLYLWVDNYCRANPLNDLSDAGFYLSIELIRRKGP